jgi:hypothetical protein
MWPESPQWWKVDVAMVAPYSLDGGSAKAVRQRSTSWEENAIFPGVIGRMIEPIIPAVLQSRGQR